MPRTPRDWTADLYPELDQVAAFKNRFKGKVLSLRDLGLRRAMEAEALGHVCIREAVGRRTSALWAHEELLPELEAAAAEIAELRAERARRAEARRLERIARITEALDDVTWMTADDRALARSHLESLPVEEISRGAIERRLLSRRLARAVEGLPRLTARSIRIAVSADIRFSAFGREITETWDPVTTIDLTPELERLLFDDDLAPFRHAVQETARAAAATAVSELRVRLFATIAEAGRTIEETVALVEFTEPADVERIRGSLVDHAVQRLESSGERALATLQKSLRDIAADLIWSRRRDLLRTGRASREGQWTLTGDRRNPVLVYTIQPQVTALGEVFTARMDRKVSLPRDLREALFRQPFDVFTGIAETYVAEQIDDEHAELERTMGNLTSRIAKIESIPGLDTRLLANTLRTEFAAKRFEAQAVASRIKALVERLTKQARETEAVQDLLVRARFAHYSDFFTTARSLERRLLLFVGPTNSGKTYHALNALAEGESGAYLAPLRLLALEGQEELEKRGCVTSFLTGEERDLREGSSFTSSTIEMLNLDRIVDAVVVDEVQLLSDPDRGWAWSAAVIGAPASKVIMTGSPDAVPLVRELAEYLGEPLEIVELARFTPLEVHDEVTDLDDVAPGTAIVCFSRRDVLGLKQYLEHRHRVSVIYGNLSPQVRREEARRFRSGETSVLVATDAIALGLNLPIRTVVFYTTWKWNGREDTRLSSGEVRQIGGRAGRFGKHDAGFVGALSYADLEHIRAAFEEPVVPLPISAQVRPSQQHILTMSEVLSSKSLARLLDVFRRRISFDAEHLVASVPDDMLDLAALGDSAGLPLEDRFVFACAPVDVRNGYMMRNFQMWLHSFAEGRPSRVDRLPSRYEHSTGESDPEAFYHAEVLVKTLTVYAWLAYRYSRLFPELDECDRQRGVLNGYIERTLRKKGRMRRCSSCGNALPPLSQYGICDACFRSKRRR